MNEIIKKMEEFYEIRPITIDFVIAHDGMCFITQYDNMRTAMLNDGTKLKWESYNESEIIKALDKLISEARNGN